MRETYEQLIDGYESTLDSVSELAETLSDVQETVVDALSEMHGDIQSLLYTLRISLKLLHQMATEQESTTII